MEQKDPKNTKKAIDPDVEEKKVKRRIADLLPGINQTETVKKFFNATVDHLFEPQDFKKISGFIGRKTSYWDNNTEFYLGEKNNSRQNYQLEPAALSKDVNENITNVLFYSDIINYIRFSGGIVNDHNRLFGQEYYSWAPPIDLDKFTAFWNYYWIPEGINEIEITDQTNVVGDLLGKQYPDHNHVIWGEDGQVYVSSGIRIILRDDTTPFYNNKIFTIEGVGRSIILVEEDEFSTSEKYGWDAFLNEQWDVSPWDGVHSSRFDNTPDYITIERGSIDGNMWSKTNHWYHKDVIDRSGSGLTLDYSRNQARRPIIEFERNIELYNFKVDTKDTVDVVYTGTDLFGPDGLQGRKIYDPVGLCSPTPCVQYNYSSNQPPLDWHNGQHGIIDVTQSFLDIPVDTLNPINAVNNIRTIDGLTSIRDGMKILVKNDVNSSINNKIYMVSGIQQTGIVNLLEVHSSFNQGDQVLVRLGREYGGVSVIFDGSTWKKAQQKANLNQPPLFQLYDYEETPLNDVGVYPNSTFKGNKLFGFSEGSELNPIDPIYNIRLKRDQFGETVYKNFIVTDTYTYSNEKLPISGFYFYKNVISNSFNNGWFSVDTPTIQYVNDEFITEKDQTNFELSITPDTVSVGGLPPIIVSKNGIRLQKNINFFINDNIVHIPSAVEGDLIFVKSFSSEQVNSELFFEIPLNLQANPTNLEVTEVSATQYTTHFEEIINNQENLDGVAFSINRWRDTIQNKSLGRQILQHSSPLLKLMILSSIESLEIPTSIRFVEREYSRTRNKLIQKFNMFLMDAMYSTEPPSKWVSDALEQINIGKTEDFPFYYSNMIFEGSFIPSTPNALGLLPVYKPEAYLDNTFITPQWTIRGHDGSQYIMFGQTSGGVSTQDPNDLLDKRDAAYLEFENLIYNNIPSKFKNEEELNLNWNKHKPGKFRDTQYSRKEYLQILQPAFERWVSTKGVNYRENDTFSPENKFTWNYNSSLDIDGEELPGHWRGVYNWYFDTDRPHTHPWEMLGFYNKPSWWESEYGPAPYTGGNTIMWADLEQGIIRQGPRQGTDIKYARPGLLNFIPVDSSGKLLDPVTAGIVPIPPVYAQITNPWVFGDNGPIENVWIKSEYYSFAVSNTFFLMKPAEFVEIGWDPEHFDFIFKNTNFSQWINSNTKNRPKPNELIVHGETLPDGTVFIGSGIQQWISDWIINNGKQVTNSFGNIIRGINVQLSHKMGGFTDPRNLTVLTDNFGLVPSENVFVESYLSASISEHMYSGVIIEWTGHGWVVFGYDVLNPYFNIIPENPYGNKIIIKVGEPEIELPNHWQDSTSYSVDSLVRYQGIIYKANTSHTSSQIFERNLWSFVGTEYPSTGIRVTEYLEPNEDGIQLKIPYGTLFKTQQEVYNFLINYSRWLKKEGWVFDYVMEEINTTLDWRYSGKEFLMWSLNSWSEGSFIALSPGAQQVKFKAEHGIIQSIEQNTKGVYSLLNKVGARIDYRDTTITRTNEELKVKSENIDVGIYACRLFVKEYEHILLLSNKTIFNDLMYDPLYNVSQPRLKINGIVTKGWTGRLDAPGFIVHEGRIFSNFEKTVDDFRRYFEIEKAPSNPILRDHARHLIGFQARDYLKPLLVDPDVDFQFYQGMIQAKGSPSSITELLKAERSIDQERLDFFEEWAIRIGNYGATDLRGILEFQLDRGEIRKNPQIIEFNSEIEFDNPFDNIIQLNDTDSRWMRKPQTIDNIWPLRDTLLPLKGDMPTAGYVKIDEITYPIVNIEKANELLGQVELKERETIWIYDFESVGSFAVLRAENIIPDKTLIKAIEPFPTIIEFNEDIQNIIDNIVGEGYVFVNKNKNKVQEGLLILNDVVKSYTIITGSDSPSVSSGDQFILNGTTITITDNSLDSIVSDINAANIPGISATAFNGLLRIRSENPYNSTTNNIVLDNVTPNTVKNLGLTVEPHSIINGIEISEETSNIEDFSEFLDEDTPTLLFLRNVRTNDINERDDISTKINSSGTPLIDGEFIWVDSVDHNGIYKWIRYVYKDGEWSAINDIDTIIQPYLPNNSFIKNGVVYDKRTNRINSWIEVFDPKIGEISGVAKKELKYILDYDPATYNVGDEEVFKIDENKPWGKNEVGRLWWDISSVKYLDYTAGDLGYASRWWGKIAPGTSIDVYEWVESSVPPVEYSNKIGQVANSSVGGASRITGEPKNLDDPVWSEREVFDPTTGSTRIKYYFWVKNKETKPNVPFRNISCINVARILQDPTQAGLAWFAPITKSALLVSNIQAALVDNDTVLQINWLDIKNKIKFEYTQDLENENIYHQTTILDSDYVEKINLHREWTLIREGDKSSIPPEMHWNKMVDSLVGFVWANNIQSTLLNFVKFSEYNDLFDKDVLVVPDTNLSEVEKYGTLFRPRQTWFKHIWNTRQVFVEKVNQFLNERPIVKTQLDWDEKMFLSDPIPDSQEYMHHVSTIFDRDTFPININDTILVDPTPETFNRWTLWRYIFDGQDYTWLLLKMQRYSMNDYWYYIDWYAEGYSQKTPINFTFSNLIQFNTAVLSGTFSNNDIILVEDTGQGEWSKYVYLNGSVIEIGIERGTIQIRDVFYRYIQQQVSPNNLYFNETDYPWDELDTFPEVLPYPYLELRILSDALREDILNQEEVNILFFTMIRYVHSEQSMVDWVFKTSFIFLTSTEDEITQKQILRADLTQSFIDYINEVKPYHAKIRSFQQNKELAIEFYNAFSTDFDNPVYFDSENNIFRPLELENPSDVTILQGNRPWEQWYEDYQNGYPNVRKMTSTIKFDRTKCWTDVPITGSNNVTMDILATADSKSYTLFSIQTYNVQITRIILQVEPLIVEERQGDNESRIYLLPKNIEQAEVLTIWINDVLQIKDTDYYIIDAGVSVQFVNPPLATDVIKFQIDEAFDGNSYITIGDSILNNTGLLTQVDGDLQNFNGVRSFNLDENYNIDTNIIVTFNKGTSTKGRVNIRIDYEVSINLNAFDINSLDAIDRVALYYRPNKQMPRKVIEEAPNQHRVKGIGFSNTDVYDDAIWTKKHILPTLVGCEYKGTNIEGYKLNLGGYDTEPFFTVGWDSEESDDAYDLHLSGGQSTFKTYIIHALSHFDSSTYNFPLTLHPAYSIVGFDNTIRKEYTLNVTFSNPDQVKISIDGGELFSQGPGPDSYQAIAPNKIIFGDNIAPVTGQIILVVIVPLGVTFIPAPLNDSDTIIEGNQFLQPYYDSNRPEELVKSLTYSNLQLNVFYEGVYGSPSIVSNRFIGDGVTRRFNLTQTPQSRNAVWVYSNEKLQHRTTHYFYDYNQNQVVFSAPPASGTIVKITSFSIGGGLILEEINTVSTNDLGAASNPLFLDNPTIKQNVLVFVNGNLSDFMFSWQVNQNNIIKPSIVTIPEPLENQKIDVVSFLPNVLQQIIDTSGQTVFTLNSAYNEDNIMVLVNNLGADFFVIGNTLTIQAPIVVGDDVHITVYEPSEPSIVMNEQFLAGVTGPQTFTLSNPIQTTRPIHSVVFVSKNGIRLKPENTYYQHAAEGQTSYALPKVVNINSNPITVWVNNLPMSRPTDYVFDTTPFPTTVFFNFALKKDDVISVFINEGVSEFTVLSPTQIRIKEVEPNDRISIGYMSFDESLNMKTQIFTQVESGRYELAQSPYNSDYIWVHENGNRKTLLKDYKLDTYGPGFDIDIYNSAPYDDETTTKTILVMNPFLGKPSEFGAHPNVLIDSSGNVFGAINFGWDMYPWYGVYDNITWSLYPEDYFGEPLAPEDPPLTFVVATNFWDTGIYNPDYPWFDIFAFDSEFWDSFVKKDIIVTTVAGPPMRRNIAYKIFQNDFEINTLSRISDPHTLVLDQDLYFESNDDLSKEIILRPNPNLHPSVIGNPPLYIPVGSEPGVLFIEEERIEYWEVEVGADSAGPYWKIPYQSINFTDPPRVEKLPRFLRRTKSTSARPVYPRGTLVVSSGPDQTFNLPFEAVDTGVDQTSLKVDIFSQKYTGDGMTTAFSAPVIPTLATITSVWEVTGPSVTDRILIDSSEYAITADEIVFNEPVNNGKEIEIVSVALKQFDYLHLNTPETEFLKATFGRKHNT